jgi:hypothetical protein
MAVERSRWRDERLDDLAERVVRHDARGGKVDDLRDSVEDMRRELLEMRRNLGGQVTDMRRNLGGQITDLRRDLYSTRLWLWSMGLGLAAIFVEIALRA